MCMTSFSSKANCILMYALLRLHGVPIVYIYITYLPLCASCSMGMYLIQDIEDDQKIAVKSTARLFGHEKAKLWLTGFATCMVSGLTLVGHNAGHPWPYFATVAACAAHLAWQVRRRRWWMLNSGCTIRLSYGCSVYIVWAYCSIRNYGTCMFHLSSCMWMAFASSTSFHFQIKRLYSLPLYSAREYMIVSSLLILLLRKIGSVNLYSYDDCLRKFKSNHHLGALVFTGIVITMLLKKTDELSDCEYHDD